MSYGRSELNPTLVLHDMPTILNGVSASRPTFNNLFTFILGQKEIWFLMIFCFVLYQMSRDLGKNCFMQNFHILRMQKNVEKTRCCRKIFPTRQKKFPWGAEALMVFMGISPN